MKLPTTTYTFKLLTVCFCGGAHSQQAPAEMRVPSIRGQVRAIHREISSPAEVNRIWGSTDGAGGASRVGTFLVSGHSSRAAQPRPYILPHKHQGTRPGIAEGQTFSITLQRLIGCSESDWLAANKAFRGWLLLGCIGLRSSRAAGSVWPVAVDGTSADWIPANGTQLAETLRTYGFKRSFWIVDTPGGTSAEGLRSIASDTVNGRPHLFGRINPRTPSPTKFKVVELAEGPRLLVSAPQSITETSLRSALSGPNKAGTYEWLVV